MKRNLLTGGLVILSAVMSGCGGGVYASSYVAPAPPAPRYGVMGVAPGPGFVWAEGYWDLRGRDWAWAPGRWMRPPHRAAMWVRPEWRREGQRWRFYRGYWR